MLDPTLEEQRRAEDAYRAAERQLDRAAANAIGAIDTSIAVTNDGFLDHAGHDLRSALGHLGVLEEFVDGVLAPVFEDLGQAWDRQVAEVSSLATMAAALALDELLAEPDGTAVTQGDRLERLQDTLGWVAPGLALLIASRIASDVDSPTPEVRSADQSLFDAELDESQRDARESLADGRRADGAADLVRDAVYVDRMGGDDRSVVDVKRLLDDDGTVRWVVSLPSTMDWGVPSDRPATNDLDSNLALMLAPERSTQYERAVHEALSQAGVNASDPVMFVGFSQGGIMAAHLASNRADMYNVQGVLTVGSPIGTFDIDPDIAVVSVEHEWDSVHRLDMGPVPTPAEGITLVRGGVDHTHILEAHNGMNYAQTVEKHDDAHGGSISSLFADFLPRDDDVEVAREQYYWSE